MKIGSSLVPFENSFPKDTKLYSLMTTKPVERWEALADSSFVQQDAMKPVAAGTISGSETDDREAFTRKIREVAEGNDAFGELVKKYLENSNDTHMHAGS